MRRRCLVEAQTRDGARGQFDALIRRAGIVIEPVAEDGRDGVDLAVGEASLRWPAGR